MAVRGAQQVRGKIKSIPGAIVSTKDAGTNEFRISGWASKPSVDRLREVIDRDAFSGTLDIFNQNPVMLLMHDTKQPIGHWDRVELRAEGLWVSGTIDHGYPAAEQVRKQIEQGSVRALSIGFREKAGGPNDDDGLWHIKELELLEISVVSVPANRDALFSMENGKCVGVEELPEQTPEEIRAMNAARGVETDPDAVIDVPAARAAAGGDPDDPTPDDAGTDDEDEINNDVPDDEGDEGDADEDQKAFLAAGQKLFGDTFTTITRSALDAVTHLHATIERVAGLEQTNKDLTERITKIEEENAELKSRAADLEMASVYFRTITTDLTHALAARIAEEEGADLDEESHTS